MFCSQCGTEAKSDAVFCHICGFNLAISRAKTAQISQLVCNEEVDTQLVGVKGWLLFLCISLTIITPIFTLWIIDQEARVSDDIGQYFGNLFVIETFLNLGIALFSIYAGFSLWTVKQNAVSTAKAFYLTYLAYRVAYPFIVYNCLSSNTPSWIITQVNNVVITESLKAVALFAIWFTYLCRSKRVKATYDRALINGANS